MNDTGNVLDFIENTVRNRRLHMKKVLSFLLTISLVFVLCSCLQGADTNTIKYHSNKTINKLINNFNEILVEGEEIQITQDMVRKGAYDFSATISINGVWIIVYDSSNGLSVDYQLESADDTPISSLFYRFVKATNSDITDDEISLAWSELQTNKYQNYNYYNFDKFECTYAKQQLVNGEYRYTIKTRYKN